MLALLMCIAAIGYGCTQSVNLSNGLRVQTVTSGWVDQGLASGKKKLVPTLSISFKNASDKRLPMLQVNALFRRVGDDQEWGTDFVTIAGSDGLPPGGATAVSVKSPQGYTGTESAREMLANSHFVDARVDIYAKYGSARWTRLGQYRISRQLLAR